MNYTVCTIREVLDGPVEADEGLIYPVPLDEADSVAVEPRDGDDIKRVNCTAVEVRVQGDKGKPLLLAPDIRAQPGHGFTTDGCL